MAERTEALTGAGSFLSCWREGGWREVCAAEAEVCVLHGGGVRRGHALLSSDPDSVAFKHGVPE